MAHGSREIFGLRQKENFPLRIRGSMDMTPKLLKDYCKKDGLYSTPHLNDRLYLHYKGFRAVTNLEPYTGLKVLWLEGNGLSAISGLGAQTEMRTLYLQENLLERIENLEHMVRCWAAPPSPTRARAGQRPLPTAPCPPCAPPAPPSLTPPAPADGAGDAEPLQEQAAPRGGPVRPHQAVHPAAQPQ